MHLLLCAPGFEDALLEEVRELGTLIDQLRETVKATRMVALETESASWRLAVREPADALGKEVLLRLDLAGVELDKVVVERLRQPMLHLLRNAVDHGIEVPADRFAFAKMRWGTIDVRARLAGTMVRIEVRDDGCGLDRAVIERKAVERGLVTAAAASAMPDPAVFALLFSPGFSTREEAGPWSGRGVGLDVVARAVEQLGGHVHIASAGPSQGTSVTLILPASVVSTRGLLVGVGEAVFALSVELVGRVGRVFQISVELFDCLGIILAAAEKVEQVQVHVGKFFAVNLQRAIEFFFGTFVIA